MNRFLSKLDLRDIKIDPAGSRFPPDEDEQERRDETSTPVAEEVISEHAAESDVPAENASNTAWEPAATPSPAGSPVHDEDEPDAESPIVSYDENGAGELPLSPDVLKVSARSRPSAVAGAIAGVVRELGRAEIQAIGAGATNQAVKAVAIARDYLRETGIEVVCLPEFIDITIDDEDRTAMLLVVEPR